MSSRPTAGQASLEYVAALALLAALFVVAAPAVGAPDIPRLVVAQAPARDLPRRERRLLGSGRQGRRPRAVPDAVRHDRPRGFGHGVQHRGRAPLDADGHAAVRRQRRRRPHRAAGAAASPADARRRWRSGRSRSRPALRSARAPACSARAGWVFPDQATADAVPRARGGQQPQRVGRLPGRLGLLEGGRELRGRSASRDRRQGLRDRCSCSASRPPAEGALGAKIARGAWSRSTAGSRSTATCRVPVPPSVAGNGREEWLVEYTFGRDGPREIAFRRIDAVDHGDRSTETADAARPARSREPRGRAAAARHPAAVAAEHPPARRRRAAPDRHARHGRAHRLRGRRRLDRRVGPRARRSEVRRRRASSSSSTSGSSRRPRGRAAPSATASTARPKVWPHVAGDVPGPELDEVVVGVVDVRRARVRAGLELVLADVEAGRLQRRDRAVVVLLGDVQGEVDVDAAAAALQADLRAPEADPRAVAGHHPDRFAVRPAVDDRQARARRRRTPRTPRGRPLPTRVRSHR